MPKESSCIEMEYPQECPFCGEKDLHRADTWLATNAEEKAITVSLDEFQCDFCGKAFWV